MKVFNFLKNFEWMQSLGTALGLGAVITAAGATSWATYTTGLFIEYHPLSWIIAGLVSGTLVSVWFLALGLFHIWKAKRILAESYAEEVKSVNPLQDNFEKMKIDMRDFFSPYGELVEGKTFKNCTFHGPVCIGLIGETHFHQPFLGHCTFVEIDTSIAAAGLVPVVGCQFVDCKFYNVVFFAEASLMLKLQSTNNQFMWIASRDAQRGPIPSPS